MIRFDFYKPHSPEFFAKHIISIHKGKWGAEVKPEGKGLAYLARKFWRWISSEDTRAVKVHRVMLNSIRTELEKAHVKPDSHLIVLGNMHSNLRGFEQAVVIPHNQSILSRVLFWTRIPEAPKEMTDQLVQRVNLLIETSKADLLKFQADKVTFEDSVEKVKDLKILLNSIEALKQSAQFDKGKLSVLQAAVLQAFDGVALKHAAETQALQTHIQNNTWTESHEKMLKQIAITHQDMDPKWFLQAFNGIHGVEGTLSKFNTVKKRLDEIKGKFDEGLKLVKEADQAFENKVKNMSRSTLSTRFAPVVAEDRMTFLQSRSYISKSEKQALANWVELWNGPIMGMLGKAEKFFDQAAKLKEDLYSLTAEDMASRDEIFGRNLGNNHHFFAIKSQVLKEIKNRMAALDTTMKELKKGCLSKKLADEMGAAVTEIQVQLDMLKDVANKKKIAEEVVDCLSDEVKLVECLSLIYGNEFDKKKPYGPQIQSLALAPLTEFYESLVAKGKGITPFAQNLRAPCVQFEMAQESFELYQEMLDAFKGQLKQAALSKAAGGKSYDALAQEFANMAVNLKDAHNKFKFETLTIIPQEKRTKAIVQFKHYESSLMMLNVLETNHACIQQLIQKCLATPKGGPLLQKLWASVDSWNTYWKQILGGASVAAAQPDRVEVTKQLLAIIEAKKDGEHHPLFGSPAYNEIQLKMKEMTCVQLLIEMRERFTGWIENTSKEPFTYSDFLAAKQMSAKGKDLFENLHKSAPQGLSSLLSNKTKEVLKLCSPQAEAKFVKIGGEVNKAMAMLSASINHKIETKAFKKMTDHPPVVDQKLYDDLIADPILGKDLAALLKNLKDLLDKRLDGYIKNYYFGEEFPPAGGVEENDLHYLNSLNAGELSKDSKKFVEILIRMQELGMHPNQVCPITQETMATNPVRTKKRPYYYFDREGIMGWLKVKQCNPMSPKESLKIEDLEPCPEVAQLIKDYKQLVN